MGKKLFMLALLLACACSTFAQRHTSGASGIEIGGGITPADKIGFGGNIAYTHYIQNAWTFKLEGIFFSYPKKAGEKSYSIYNYAAGPGIFYTALTNRRNIFLNIGAGCFAGYEDISKLESAYSESAENFNLKSKFVTLPYVGAEMELFPAGKTAIVLQAKEIYSPMSDIKKWHTYVGLAVRYIIF